MEKKEEGKFLLCLLSVRLRVKHHIVFIIRESLFCFDKSIYKSQIYKKIKQNTKQIDFKSHQKLFSNWRFDVTKKRENKYNLSDWNRPMSSTLLPTQKRWCSVDDDEAPKWGMTVSTRNSGVERGAMKRRTITAEAAGTGLWTPPTASPGLWLYVCAIKTKRCQI